MGFLRVYINTIYLRVDRIIVMGCTEQNRRVQNSTVFHYTILYYTILYCTVMYCTVLHCTALYCTVLHYNAVYCTVLHNDYDDGVNRKYARFLKHFRNTFTSSLLKYDFRQISKHLIEAIVCKLFINFSILSRQLGHI